MREKNSSHTIVQITTKHLHAERFLCTTVCAKIKIVPRINSTMLKNLSHYDTFQNLF